MSEAKLSYSDLLKNPKWQKKRLDIFQRDDFKCRACDSSESTLHVHHLKYEKDLMPWEYDDMDLVTLCEDCHILIIATEINRMLKKSSFGIESFILIVRMLDNIEQESIEKFLQKTYNE